MASFRKLTAVAAVLAFACVARASGGRSHPVRKDLKRTEERLRRQQRMLRRLEDESVRLLDQLQKLDRRLLETGEALKEATARLDESREEIQRLSRERDVLEANLAALRRRLGARMRQLYKRESLEWFGVLVASVSLGDALGRLQWLEIEARLDKRLVETLRARLQKRRQLERKLNDEMRSYEKFKTSLEAERDRLEQARRDKQALLRLATERVKLRKRALAELRRARRRLVGILNVLEGQGGATRGFASWRGRLPAPVAGAKVEVPFGLQRDERFGTVTVHHGLDLKAPAGSPVRAVYSGKVVFADWFEGYGLMVVIDHGGGYFSLYAHLDRLEVSKGQKVRKGQLLGGVGETGSLKGPYLYFEIRNRGKPVDPAKWIRP